MSLDVDLVREKWVSYDKGESHIKMYETVYTDNITHNLSKMAKEAVIYEALWRPEEINKEKAKDIVELLQVGLSDLKMRPEHYKQFNSPNGWGVYEHFVLFVENYLNACKEYPECLIETDR